MGLPVAELSEEKILASGAGSLLSSANRISNTEETVRTVSERSEGNSSSCAEKKPTMDVGGAKSESMAVAAPQNTSSLVEAKRVTDVNGSQMHSGFVKTDDSSQNTKEDNSTTEMSSVPLISEAVANFTSQDPAETDVLGEKPSPDLGDATFIKAVSVIQNLADVVEVMSVVTNDSEPPHQELQPPARDATQTEFSWTMSADHFRDATEAVCAEPLATTNDHVMAESNNACTDLMEGGPGPDVKQEAAIGSNSEGNADNLVGPDIESFLSGSSLQCLKSEDISQPQRHRL